MLPINRTILLVIICGIVFSLVLFSYMPWFSSSEMKQTFIFFPEDDQISFTQSETSIMFAELKRNNEYNIVWNFESKTNNAVYLRQDISLLFENGMLADQQTVNKQKADHIKWEGVYSGDDSGRFEAITLHYGEVHYSKNIIKSKKTMSSDILYVIDSPLSSLQIFKKTENSMERKYKDLLDTIIDQQLSYIWERLMEEYNINPEQYIHIPFNKIPTYLNEPLPMFSNEQTSEIIGKLWEGLYRYYILGINTFNDSNYDPVGNSLPLILLDKDGTHLIVLYETAGQKSQQLLQHIPSVSPNNN